MNQTILLTPKNIYRLLSGRLLPSALKVFPVSKTKGMTSNRFWREILTPVLPQSTLQRTFGDEGEKVRSLSNLMNRTGVGASIPVGFYQEWKNEISVELEETLAVVWKEMLTRYECNYTALNVLLKKNVECCICDDIALPKYCHTFLLDCFGVTEKKKLPFYLQHLLARLTILAFLGEKVDTGQVVDMPHKPPTVSDFCFSLRSGESIAFVGPSGCGKSTISKVISCLYHPWTGQILLDDQLVEQIPSEMLHASVSTVSQNIMLFSGSIRDNITMWNQAISERDMITAAKDAQIHDFIMKQPGGYDYQLTENASNLSGGERQRLEIARALATNPTILIMDEATSALDPIKEKCIMDNLRRRGCTCIIVAHRLSAIRDCDQIVVMSNGKIVQRGTHESMKNVEGFYRSFIRDD